MHWCSTFEQDFWSGRNLNELYQAVGKRPQAAPLERIFAAGMREFLKLRERRVADAGQLLDGARRAMRASYQREVDARPGPRCRITRGSCQQCSGVPRRSGRRPYLSCITTSAF